MEVISIHILIDQSDCCIYGKRGVAHEANRSWQSDWSISVLNHMSTNDICFSVHLHGRGFSSID